MADSDENTERDRASEKALPPYTDNDNTTTVATGVAEDDKRGEPARTITGWKVRAEH